MVTARPASGRWLLTPWPKVPSLRGRPASLNVGARLGDGHLRSGEITAILQNRSSALLFLP